MLAFGADKPKPGQRMHDQVTVHHYQDPDNFVIEIRTRSKADRLILAKLTPANTLLDTIRAVQSRLATTPEPLTPEDRLAIPKLKFEIARDFRPDFPGRLNVSNKHVAKDIQVVVARQDTRFDMDERGVTLVSETQISLGCSAAAPARVERILYFDKPFLIMIQRTNSAQPYFALWVGNPAMMLQPG